MQTSSRTTTTKNLTFGKTSGLWQNDMKTIVDYKWTRCWVHLCTPGLREGVLCKLVRGRASMGSWGMLGTGKTAVGTPKKLSRTDGLNPLRKFLASHRAAQGCVGVQKSSLNFRRFAELGRGGGTTKSALWVRTRICPRLRFAEAGPTALN